jgi:hypothetical protein
VQQKKADDARPSRSMGATARVSRPVSDDCRELKGTLTRDERKESQNDGVNSMNRWIDALLDE